MKNKLKTLLTVLLASVMCFSAMSLLTACGEEEKPAEDAPIVYSNGGTVVCYDNDVYFINGIPDYTDASGKTNLQGSVVKGGLYKTTVAAYREADFAKAELEQAKKEAADGEEPVVDKNADGLYDVLDFANFDKLDYIDLGQYTIGSETEDARITDDDGTTHQNFIPTNGGRSEYRIKTEQVVSKKIGTSGYADGGFWIFDGIVYFATPDTDRNAEGEVQYNRAEFYSYDLKSGSMNLLYTAKEVNASMPYTFYKQGSSVYLVTFEKYFANADDESNNILTGFIVSTEINGGRPGDTKEIVSGVDSVFFPRSETYDPNNNPGNTVRDYVYYTRSAKSSDKPSSGTRLEMVRPDGNVPEVKNGDKVVTEAGAGTKTITTNTVGTITIEGVAGDYLYYRNPVTSGKTQLECTNLATLLKEYDADVKIPEMPENVRTVIADVSAYTTIIPIEQDRPDPSVPILPCVLAGNTEGVFRISPSIPVVRVYNGEATLLGYHAGRAYANVSGEEFSTFISSSAFQDYGNQTVKLLSGGQPTSTFDLDFFTISYATTLNGKDITANETYSFYFANYDETATNYAYINKVSGINDTDGAGSVKLGQVADYERPKIVCRDDECINWTHDHSSWDDLTPDEEEETA